MDNQSAKGNDRFIVVKWPECLVFMDGKSAAHLVDDQNAKLKFGDKACFVSLSYYMEASGRPEPEKGGVYLAVGFPESQLFMDGHQHEIYLINDELGIGRYGHAAYFVEEGLYEKVVANFNRDFLRIPNLDLH